MIGGITFPYIGIIFETYLLIWLGLLLFFNLIRTDIGDILSTFTKPKILIIFAIVKLIVIPISMYFIINHIMYPKISTDSMLSIFLLSGISTGLGSPFVINFVGGKLPIVVAIVIITSLAVPFVLPALVYVLFKSQFSIPVINMILLLSSALFIPLAAGYFMKQYVSKIAKKIDQKALVFSIVFNFFYEL